MCIRDRVGTAQEVRMENYKNSKIGLETAKKYGDILETVSYTHLDVYKRQPYSPSIRHGKQCLKNDCVFYGTLCKSERISE